MMQDPYGWAFAARHAKRSLKVRDTLRPRQRRPCWYGYSLLRTLGRPEQEQVWFRLARKRRTAESGQGTSERRRMFRKQLTVR